MAIVDATEEDERQVASVILDLVAAPAAGNLVELYYNPDWPFAGRTFDDLGGGVLTAANTITEADLLAVSLLDVPFPPKAVRRLLGDEALIATMDRLLSDVPTDADLWEVEREALEVADRAWAELVELPGVGPVRAGKLLARKRPRVVPIWDEVVSATVGEMHGDWWSVLRRCLREEPDLRSRIDGLRPEVSVSVIQDPRRPHVDDARWIGQRCGRKDRGRHDSVGQVNPQPVGKRSSKASAASSCIPGSTWE